MRHTLPLRKKKFAPRAKFFGRGAHANFSGAHGLQNFDTK